VLPSSPHPPAVPPYKNRKRRGRAPRGRLRLFATIDHVHRDGRLGAASSAPPSLDVWQQRPSRAVGCARWSARPRTACCCPSCCVTSVRLGSRYVCNTGLRRVGCARCVALHVTVWEAYLLAEVADCVARAVGNAAARAAASLPPPRNVFTCSAHSAVPPVRPVHEYSGECTGTVRAVHRSLSGGQDMRTCRAHAVQRGQREEHSHAVQRERVHCV
jgi:hypothetical protein